MADIDLTSTREIKKLLNKHGTGTKKSFGQNFLISRTVPQKIAVESLNHKNSEKKCADTGVIEIGAGIGTLSKELCKIYKKVVAVELDTTLAPVLSEVLEDTSNFKVIFGDILKTDLKDLISREFADCSEINICANLPYYITTPVIAYILESEIKFGTITVMIQKEVASRLCAKPGGRDYGAITLLINYYGSISKLFDVPPSNFFPPPKVTSSVVRIALREPHEISPELKEMLFKVIRAAFEQRRKTLVNALSSALESDGIGKTDISDVVGKVTGNINIRGEMLGLDEFMKIADLLNVF